MARHAHNLGQCVEKDGKCIGDVHLIISKKKSEGLKTIQPCMLAFVCRIQWILELDSIIS